MPTMLTLCVFIVLGYSSVSVSNSQRYTGDRTSRFNERAFENNRAVGNAGFETPYSRGRGSDRFEPNIRTQNRKDFSGFGRSGNRIQKEKRESWKSDRDNKNRYNRQSSNGLGSCTKSTKCVRLPIHEQQGYYYVPECIEMPVCDGGCWEGGQTCHATKITTQQVQVKVYRYSGGTEFEFVKDDKVTVEKADECGCASCVPQDSCGRNKRWDDCKCVCNNEQSANNCGFEKEWSEENCECRCKSKRCGTDQFLDPVTCRCLYISGVNNDDFLRDNGNQFRQRRGYFPWK